MQGDGGRARRNTNFRFHGEEESDDEVDAGEKEESISPLQVDNLGSIGSTGSGGSGGSGGGVRRRRSSSTVKRASLHMGNVSQGDMLPIRRTSSIQSFASEASLNTQSSKKRKNTRRKSSIPLTMEQKTLLKMFSTDNRDQAVDDILEEEISDIESKIKQR